MVAALTMLVTLIPVRGVPVLSWVFPSTYSHVAYTMCVASVFKVDSAASQCVFHPNLTSCHSPVNLFYHQTGFAGSHYLSVI
ncbi:hypothetical protein SAMN05192544_102862 [Paraburkholderia hospita]|nr:hypothetical protein SAMN05192544_102862 [Paraburkholderia hospita]